MRQNDEFMLQQIMNQVVLFLSVKIIMRMN